MHFHDEDRRIENLLSYTYKFLRMVRIINNHNMILIKNNEIKTIIIMVVKATVFRT